MNKIFAGIVLIFSLNAFAGIEYEEITSQSLGDKWPLIEKIKSVKVACLDGRYAIAIADNGNSYGLNGMSVSKGGFPPIDPILAWDDNGYNQTITELKKSGYNEKDLSVIKKMKMNISPIFDKAVSLCNK